VPTTFDADTGSAIPAANTLTVAGSGGISTSGAGAVLTIDTDGTLADTYQADSGSATPAAGIIQVLGGANITTSATGNAITITGTGGGGSCDWQLLDYRSANSDFAYDNTLITSTYNSYRIVFHTKSPVYTVAAQISDDNGSTYKTTNYQNIAVGGTSNWNFIGVLAYPLSGEVVIGGIDGTAENPTYESAINYRNSSTGAVNLARNNGYYNGTPLVVNNIKIITTSSYGYFWLYGQANP
jgi:hypothetical protein